MTHLSMEDLTLLRESLPAAGAAAAREHLAACPACQAELERLHQRVARLRALPTVAPARDRWPEVRRRVVAERRRRQYRWLGVGGFAAAASITLALLVNNMSHPQPVSASTEDISRAMDRSHSLEQALDTYDPDSRVTDGVTAQAAGELEDRIAVIDNQLESAQMLDAAARNNALLRLWRERVGLMDALVDVHITHASNVGL
ncbi:MAG: hypothetical protein ABJD11_03785 [Gemmatimonadota bacterium]